MAGRRSAGLLAYRRTPAGGLEVLIGHMGGPYWARRDERAWSIPKGEHDDAESAQDAARREFAEELGLPVPDGELVDLGSVRQSGGKEVTVWAVDGAALDASAAVSNTFTMEWPRGSGRVQEFPELDRLAWVPVDAAAPLLVAAQRTFLDRLVETITPA